MTWEYPGREQFTSTRSLSRGLGLNFSQQSTMLEEQRPSPHGQYMHVWSPCSNVIAALSTIVVIVIVISKNPELIPGAGRLTMFKRVVAIIYCVNQMVRDRVHLENLQGNNSFCICKYFVATRVVVVVMVVVMVVVDVEVIVESQQTFEMPP